MNRTTRDFPIRVELRDNGGEMPDIVGVAAVFYDPNDTGTEFRLWDGAVERIMPTAFDQAIAEQADIYASFNHNADNVMGRVSAGTLSLAKSDLGLEYTIRSNDSSTFYREMVSRIERGDVAGSSITFSPQPNGVEWVKDEDGPDVRELHSVTLYELGPVVSPAYTATATGLRSESMLAEARESHEQWTKATKSALEHRKRQHRLNYLDTLMDRIIR